MLVSNISPIGYVNCDMSVAPVLTSSSLRGQYFTLSAPGGKRFHFHLEQTRCTCSIFPLPAVKFPRLRGADVKLATAAHHEPISAPSHLPVPSLPAPPFPPRASLCLSEMAMSPAISALTGVLADLQTPRSDSYE